MALNNMHGINRIEAGALARASFEETVELLIDAAGAAELDDCKGVSESVMLGQLAPIGTGSFGVVLDEEALKNAPIQTDPLLMGAGGLNYAVAMTPMQTPYFDRSPSPLSQGGFSPVGNVQFSPLGAGTAAKTWLGVQYHSPFLFLFLDIYVNPHRKAYRGHVLDLYRVQYHNPLLGQYIKGYSIDTYCCICFVKQFLIQLQ
jgi:hypothetical protein